MTKIWYNDNLKQVLVNGRTRSTICQILQDEAEAKLNDRQYCHNYVGMRKQTLCIYTQACIGKILVCAVLNQRATSLPAVNSYLNVWLSKTLIEIWWKYCIRFWHHNAFMYISPIFNKEIGNTTNEWYMCGHGNLSFLFLGNINISNIRNLRHFMCLCTYLQEKKTTSTTAF